MPDDHPDALEAVLKYLYSVSPEWVNNHSIHTLSHGLLPEGYMQWLIEVFRVAEKYGLDLLAEQVVAIFKEDAFGCSDCWNVGRLSKYSCHKRCIDIKSYPVQILQTIALCETLGDSHPAKFLRHSLYDCAAQMTQTWKLLSPTILASGLPEGTKEIVEVLSSNPTIGIRMMAFMARTMIHLQVTNEILEMQSDGRDIHPADYDSAGPY